MRRLTSTEVADPPAKRYRYMCRHVLLGHQYKQHVAPRYSCFPDPQACLSALVAADVASY